jgi:hypothetical protein
MRKKFLNFEKFQVSFEKVKKTHDLALNLAITFSMGLIVNEVEYVEENDNRTKNVRSKYQWWIQRGDLKGKNCCD